MELHIAPRSEFPESNGPFERLRAYLWQSVLRGVLEERMADTAWLLWTRISEAQSGDVQVPDACVGRESDVLFTWDDEQHHAELEVAPDEPAFFFYRNRITGATWGSELPMLGPLPEEVGRYLHLFPNGA